MTDTLKTVCLGGNDEIRYQMASAGGSVCF
jgi:hypothetical protein